MTIIHQFQWKLSGAPPTFQALVLTFLLEKHIQAVKQVGTYHMRLVVH